MTKDSTNSMAVEPKKQVSLPQLFLVFTKIGAFTFGGGYAMLPIIQREVVVKRKWVDREFFLDALIITQSLPGLLAVNTAIQIGMRLRATPGGIIAVMGAITPSIVIILAIAGLFLPAFQNSIYVQAIFYGIRPAVVALIASAAFKIGQEILGNWAGISLVAALLAVGLLINIHPIAVLLTGGLAGMILFRRKNEIVK